ncbi:hypothetical protein HOK00_02585, partial [bacterium]|nr:hypothetical protein [bacterium]
GYKFSKYNDQTKGINLLFYGILVFLFYKTILSPGLGQMNRYFIFIEPLIILLFFYSIKDIGNRKYIYIASIIISITSFASFAKVKNPYIISSMNQGAMGMSNYITTHLDNNTAIAIENAGMKYFLDNKTVDIVGLTTKELNTKENLYRKDDMSFIFNYLSTNNVEYIQFFPTWFERIYGKEPEFLTKIYELKINNPIFNVERWAIYRFNKEDYDAYISNNDGKK